MMNEIEKMYELAGVEGVTLFEPKHSITLGDYDEEYIDYPPFTAEKQLELIKWLGTTEYYTFGIFYHQGLWYIFTETTNRNDKKFDECLAKLINDLWQDLAENEQEEIRKILKE